MKVDFDECYEHLKKGYTIDIVDSENDKVKVVDVYGSISSILPKKIQTEEEIHKDVDRIKDLYFKK
jgi:hypothetical protein